MAIFSDWRKYDSRFLLDIIVQHARFVGAAKIALAIVAIMLLASVVILSISNTDDSRFELVFSSIETSEKAEPVMVNPWFHGLDEVGNPF